MSRCRACLRECRAGAEGRALFEGGVAQALATLTSLQILPEDHLPTLICLECHKDLCNSHSFIKKAKESHEILHGSLDKSNKINGNPESHLLFDNEKSLDADGDKCIANDLFEGYIPSDDISKCGKLGDIFDGNAVINYCEKSTQVNFECEHEKNNAQRDSGSSNCNIVDQPSEEVCEFVNDYSLLNESEIKQEPEEDDAPYNIGEDLENDLTVTNIKVEPLSENDALKFYQKSLSNNDKMECEEYLELSGLNGYMSHDSLNSGDDIKPSEEDLEHHSTRYKISLMDFEGEKDDADPNSCNICGKVLANQIALCRHVQIHKTHQICILCNRCFRTTQRLKNHVVMYHSYGELKKCFTCNKTFKTPGDLALHKMTHVLPSINVTCNFCLENFSSEMDLKEHMAYHREIVVLKKGDSEYTLCSKCNSSFSDHEDLYHHVKNVCQIPEFPISEDIKPNTSKEENDNSHKFLFENISSSQKNKLLKQNFNGKTFKKKSREHCCPHCPQVFSNKYLLRIHLDQHSSFVRGFCCPICSFKFKRKDHLTRHLNNVHSLEKEKKRIF